MAKLTPAAQILLDLARDDAEQRSDPEFSYRHVFLAALDLGSDGPLAPILHVGRDADFRRVLETGIQRRPPSRRLQPPPARISPHFDYQLRMALASQEDVAVRKLLLLGLSDSAIAGYLRRVGISASQLVELAEDSTVPATMPLAPEAVAAGDGKRSTSNLAAFGRDLTRLAREGKLNGAVGRQAEVLRLRAALNRMNQNNPLLVGLPGTGKTAIVEQLAIEIASGSLPELVDVTLIELDLAGMVAGTRYRGEFEERLKGIIETIRAAAGKMIPFIDEIHMIVGAGSAEGSMDTANILKPALARGELRVIGATTPMEHRLRIETDGALDRRFNVIRVEPPTAEETERILQGVLPRFERHHKVPISPGAATAAVKLSGRYLTSRQFPDKALFLLDDAAAFARAAEPKLERVEAHHVADATERVTGVPVKHLQVGDRERLVQLADRLSSLVVGQPDAVKAVVERMKEVQAGMASPERPIPGFLFVGPSGVGKTHLAKTFAEEFFKTPGAFQRFDMSQYADHGGLAALLGAPMGTIGSDRGGALTNTLRQHPHAVYLFDEIEKGDTEVLNIFLGILDSGRPSGRDGVQVDARHAVFMFTSNLGRSVHDDSLPFDKLRELYVEALHAKLPPELVGRMEVIPFYGVSPKSARSIVRLQFEELGRLARAANALDLQFEETAVDALVDIALDRLHGARALRRAVDERVKRPLVDFLLTRGAPARGGKLVGHWSDGERQITFRVVEA